MPAAAVGCSSEGDESVKAGEDAVEAASIAAPATAAIDLRERMRKSMASSRFSTDPATMDAPSEFAVNASWLGDRLTVPNS
jgi:hypothetical protein